MTLGALSLIFDMKKILFPLFIFITIWQSGISQVLPPVFNCVKGDTLFWDLPLNNCGPFNSYDIYASQSPGGPFILLAAVTDASQTVFHHPNPAGETWYYYLQSNHNCPGQPVVSSDTLDNRPPVVSPIRSASVEGNTVVLNWHASPSPEVFAYVIYRTTSVGVIPIDTVFGITTYTDLNANPEDMPESYYVNALDRCGNTSIFDVAHRTINLEGEVDPCKRTIDLNWNLYQTWAQGPDVQEVWVSVNGGAPTNVNTIGGGLSEFSFPDVNDGVEYCVYILSKEAGTGEISKSNQVCFTADVVQPMKNLIISNLNVTPGGEVEVHWLWDTGAEITNYSVQNGVENGFLMTIATLPAPATLPQSNSYLDTSGDPNIGKVYYHLFTVDNCDSIVESNISATIFLSGLPLPGNINQLSWSPLDIDDAVLTSYDLFRTGGSSGDTKIATLTALNYDDPFEPSQTGQTGACYFVVANYELTTPGGETLSLRSRSNTFCVEQPLRVFLPNAFAPRGINQEFKPLIVPFEFATFEMRIFDRYGQQLFFSGNPDEGWNGKHDAKDMPQGIYAYRIRVVQASGKIEERFGTLMLLR
jgi:gliding motility-associated-like protein